ncbi:peptidoglycan-binding domain-containing protein [Ancylomarina sp. YFZ004]
MSSENTTLPNYKHTALAGDRISQLGQFDDILEDARQQGVINDVPSNELETYNYKAQQIRLQTIASRLYLLGYLKKKIPKKKIEKRLVEIKTGVRQFQLEANLKQDNWVGNKTWYALHELVSFEAELKKDFWFAGDAIDEKRKYALHRAIQLRLWSIGLYRNKPNKNFKLLGTGALKNFRSVLQIFMIGHALPIGFNYDTISLFFDQERLTKAISKRSSPGGESFLLNSQGKNDRVILAQKFIVNTVKVELWLHGFNVRIDGINNYTIDLGSDLYTEMISFYQTFMNKSKSEATELAKKIRPDIFLSIDEICVDVNEDMEEDVSAEIAAEMNSQQEIEKAWTYVKKKGLRLWDGMKRLWRWLKKLGKKVFYAIRDNVFKGFFRFATKAYKIVKGGISAVVKSIGIYCKGELNTPQMHCTFSKDMDSLVLISTGMTDTNAQKAIEGFQNQSKAFSIGCRIIAWIFKIFKRAISGVIGWAKLLLTLVRSYKELRLLHQDFKLLSTN